MTTKKMIKREIWIEAYNEAEADAKLDLIMNNFQFIKDGKVIPLLFSFGCYALIKQFLLTDSTTKKPL